MSQLAALPQLPWLCAQDLVFASGCSISQSKALSVERVMKKQSPHCSRYLIPVAQTCSQLQTSCVSFHLNSDSQTLVVALCFSEVTKLFPPGAHPLQRCTQPVNKSPLHLLCSKQARLSYLSFLLQNICCSSCTVFSIFSQPLLISQLPF